MKLSFEATQTGEGNAAQSPCVEKEELRGPWLVFIHYCRQLGYGEIERLCIQDGVPVFAETTKKKVKFGL